MDTITRLQKSKKNLLIKSQICPLQKSLQNTASHKIHTIIIQIQQQNYELHALVFKVRSVQLWLLLISTHFCQEYDRITL